MNYAGLRIDSALTWRDDQLVLAALACSKLVWTLKGIVSPDGGLRAKLIVACLVVLTLTWTSCGIKMGSRRMDACGSEAGRIDKCSFKKPITGRSNHQIIYDRSPRLMLSVMRSFV